MSIHSTDKDDHSPPKDHLEDVEKPAQSATYDDVFGEISEQGPNYRNVSVFGGYFVIRVNVVLNIVQVGVYGTIALLMKTQVGLGVLSIPSAFDTLGMVPGVICLLAVAAITTWSAFEIGKFKLRHRDVYGIDDVGSLFFGSIGKNFFGFIFCLCMRCISYRTPTPECEYSAYMSRLGLCRRFGDAEHLDQSQCLVHPLHLYGHFRRHRCRDRVFVREYPDPGPDHLDGMGWCVMHSHLL